MATVFEIVEKLRNGEEVIIANNYVGVLMEQMTVHSIPEIRVNFQPHGKHHKKLTIIR